MEHRFSIEFIKQEEQDHLVGLITIGDFKEEFDASLSYWDKKQYLEQWRHTQRELAEGRDGAFITDMHDPAKANFIRWWPVYIQDGHAIFHNQVLFLEQLSSPFSEVNPSRSIPPYRSVNEKGEKISEWIISREKLGE